MSHWAKEKILGCSTFQVNLVFLTGDVQTNPGPVLKKAPKYPCKECGKNIRNNQNAILCAVCNMWSHAKCLDMSTSAFKYYLQNPKLNWECNWCSLPFNELSEGELVLELETENIISRQESDTELGINANQRFINPFDNLNTKSIIDERQTDSSEALIVHLNINSIQNKFEELKILNEKLKAHVISISETKIDSSYS
jgi:hypothetical protein